MNLAYTSSFTVDTTEVVIRKGTGEVIPEGVRVTNIIIWPSKVDGNYPAYYIKGIKAGSSYVKTEAESPIFTLDGLNSDSNIYLYVKADSSITMNIAIKGDV